MLRRGPWHGGGVISEDLARLLRWESAGGTWELVGAETGWVELELLTCTGGEPMGRLRSGERDIREYVGNESK